MLTYFSSILKGVLGEKLQFIILKYNKVPFLNPLHSLVSSAIIGYSEGLEGGRSNDSRCSVFKALDSVDLSGEQVIVFIVDVHLVSGDDVIKECLSDH